MKPPIPDSYWVEPARFLAGEYPIGFTSQAVHERINAFLDSGIVAFVDLTHSRELMPYESILREAAGSRGVNADYHRFPIQDHSIPSRNTMTAILDAIDQALNSGRNIYVHCWGGIGRTGTTIGCYLVRHGWTGREALSQVQEWFNTLPKASVFPNSPETTEQARFVLNWSESLAGTLTPGSKA